MATFQKAKIKNHCEITSSKRIFANEYLSSGVPFYRGKEITIPLPAPVPVNLIYQTVWLDEAGLLQFRMDIYGRD